MLIKVWYVEMRLIRNWNNEIGNREKYKSPDRYWSILINVDQYWEPYLGISQGSGESTLPGNRWRNQRERENFTWELLREPEREPYLGNPWRNQKRDFSRRSRAQLGECSRQFVSEIEQSWNIGILRLLTAEISTLFDFNKNLQQSFSRWG